MQIPLPPQIAQHPYWHLAGVGLLLLLAVLHRQAGSSHIFIMTVWNLAGVVLHELAHLLAGMIFNARPTRMSLIPRKRGKGWEMGSVHFRRLTPFNAVPVALAPLGLAGVAWATAWFWYDCLPQTLGSTLGLYAVIFILLYNALPSGQDLSVACNWKSALIYLPPLLALILYLAWPTIRDITGK
jgi:hypothetical protein